MCAPTVNKHEHVAGPLDLLSHRGHALLTSQRRPHSCGPLCDAPSFSLPVTSLTLSPVVSCCCCCCPLPPPAIGHQYNEKIDVFSFGIILYELLSGVVLASRVAMQGEHDELLDYARKVANGHREAIPPHWPAQVRDLISRCWAQEPRKRPSFKVVLKELYTLKQAGVDVQMEGLRPRGDYNPLTDCGCCIM